MKTYTAILFSLLSIGFAANAQALDSPATIQRLESTAAYNMLSAQTEHKGEARPERGSGRRDYAPTNVLPACPL